MTPASLSKTELRTWAQQYKRGLSVGQVQQMSEGVINRLRDVEEFRRARHVFTCLSFDNEVDTWRLLDELTADPDRRVYVPRIDATGVMHVHPYPCRLKALRMGLKQPAPEEAEIPLPEIDATIDAALILGLAFERRRGYRLGHGKGYFDRFLAGKTFLTIGLSFEEQLVDRLPVESHDIPMRMVITEARTYRYDHLPR